MKKASTKKAKTIFFRYHGNGYQMASDSMWDAYKSYGIGKEQEEKWIETYFQKDILKLDINSFKTIDDIIGILLNYYKDIYLYKILIFVNSNINNISNPYVSIYIANQLIKILSIQYIAITNDLCTLISNTIKQLILNNDHLILPVGYKIPNFELHKHHISESQEEYIKREQLEILNEIEKRC